MFEFLKFSKQKMLMYNASKGFGPFTFDVCKGQCDNVFVDFPKHLDCQLLSDFVKAVSVAMMNTCKQ